MSKGFFVVSSLGSISQTILYVFKDTEESLIFRDTKNQLKRLGAGSMKTTSEGHSHNHMALVSNASSIRLFLCSYLQCAMCILALVIVLVQHFSANISAALWY